MARKRGGKPSSGDATATKGTGSSSSSVSGADTGSAGSDDEFTVRGRLPPIDVANLGVSPRPRSWAATSVGAISTAVLAVVVHSMYSDATQSTEGVGSGDVYGSVLRSDLAAMDARATEVMSALGVPPIADAGGCGVDRVANLTRDLFEAQYRGKRPVLFPATSPAAALGAEALMPLLRLADDVELPVGLVTEQAAQSNIQGQGDRSMRLGAYFEEYEYSEQRPLYVFREGILGWLPAPFVELLTPPPLFAEEHDSAPIVAIARARTGLPFHFHRAVWNEVLVGSKRWSLYAPGEFPAVGFSAWETHGAWLREVYPQLQPDQRPVECVQHPGEIMYLPEATWHATVNLDDGVAWVQQPSNAVEDSWYAHFLDGKGAHTDKRLEDSAASYEAAIERLPVEASLWRELGQVREKLGNGPGAEAAHQRCIELNARHPTCYVELAGIRLDRQDFEGARSVLQAARRAGSWHPVLNQFRQQLAQQAGGG